MINLIHGSMEEHACELIPCLNKVLLLLLGDLPTSELLAGMKQVELAKEHESKLNKQWQ